ncbi:MAG: cyclic nucleotide-binding domain-containing protein [Candidatus Aminicenantes bacterium]|nr:cyclic nucleotide-binding domain-containing protein [Candidatus Aminicenantes bacterium]MDH5705362.1 cyclic nucleotide-binding domain-containing protein [Candidatus Aminicenantes bacterium]
MVTIEELKKFKVFEGLTDAELENISEIARKEEYEAGKRIFDEKSQAAHLYTVLKGKVEIKMSADKGRELMRLDMVGPGEIFGWSSVTEPYTLTAAAWTMEKTELLVFNGEVLRDLFKKNNHIGYKVMMRVASVISSRLRSLSQKFVNSL